MDCPRQLKGHGFSRAIKLPRTTRLQPLRLRYRIWLWSLEKAAILLLAHGTPETLDDIPAYLRNVVSGRPMPDHVVEEIRHRYSLIGKSPLTEITMLQGAAARGEDRPARLRRHAQLEALHRRRGEADARRRNHLGSGHLPCSAELAHQRRPLSPRRLCRGWRCVAARIRRGLGRPSTAREGLRRQARSAAQAAL